MDIKTFNKISDYLWEVPKSFRSDMRVPARIYASEKLLLETEDEAINQIVNSTTLPGIARYAIAMPDIHQGYGPPIGGVGAMVLPEGIISPGFVGYDQNCGCRLLLADETEKDVSSHLEQLASEMQRRVPSGLERGRAVKLSAEEMDAVLEGGIPYLVKKGYGKERDIEFCEEGGRMKEADASLVSAKAKRRGEDQLGTLGSGNHFLEIQKIEEIFDNEKAEILGLKKGRVAVMIHTGSRGLGHQNCSDYLKVALGAMGKYGIRLPDRELACVPFNSVEGRNFYGAMSAACNFAWANRHMIAYYVRQAWNSVLGNGSDLKLVYDVAHNIAKVEQYEIGGKEMELIVHRKGATRSFPPGHSDIPEKHKTIGQVSLIPGTMGTASYILSGNHGSEDAWHTVCHGAGRRMSRKEALRRMSGEEVIKNLEKKGIVVKCYSKRGIAEESPEAYKDINEVVDVIHYSGLATKIAKLVPLAAIKGE